MRTYKILDLEICARDYHKHLTCKGAELFVKYLGEGWRLPTIQEFRLLRYFCRDKIGKFSLEQQYLSSDQDYYDFMGTPSLMIKGYYFGSGEIIDVNYRSSGGRSIRLVRKI